MRRRDDFTFHIPQLLSRNLLRESVWSCSITSSQTSRWPTNSTRTLTDPRRRQKTMRPAGTLTETLKLMMKWKYWKARKINAFKSHFRNPLRRCPKARRYIKERSKNINQLLNYGTSPFSDWSTCQLICHLIDCNCISRDGDVLKCWMNYSLIMMMSSLQELEIYY